MRISTAPLKSAITDTANASSAWANWLGAVGTALAGEWSQRDLTTSGKCAMMGSSALVVSFDWAAYPGAVSISLPVAVENGVLQMYDENGIFLIACIVSGNTINVPANAHTGRTIASGAFVVKGTR